MFTWRLAQKHSYSLWQYYFIVSSFENLKWMESKIRPHSLIWTNKDGNQRKVVTSNFFNLNK